jgi:hypothetical protein
VSDGMKGVRGDQDKVTVETDEAYINLMLSEFDIGGGQSQVQCLETGQNVWRS